MKSNCLSIEDRSVEHDDYRHRRRRNCNDDRRSWRMENSADSEIGSKQNNGLHCKWTVKCRCLLKIEVLNTMIILIDDVQIAMTMKRQRYWAVESIQCV